MPIAFAWIIYWHLPSTISEYHSREPPPRKPAACSKCKTFGVNFTGEHIGCGGRAIGSNMVEWPCFEWPAKHVLVTAVSSIVLLTISTQWYLCIDSLNLTNCTDFDEEMTVKVINFWILVDGTCDFHLSIYDARDSCPMQSTIWIMDSMKIFAFAGGKPTLKPESI